MTSLAIRRFADRLDTLYGKTTDAAGLALGTGDMLRSVLALDHVLEPAEREPDPNRYRQHILHIDPAGRFSIVALVWLPGQGTPIHDHLAWCVAGVSFSPNAASTSVGVASRTNSLAMAWEVSRSLRGRPH